MKAWYDDIDAATLQKIKTYSAFNDAKSKNLMMQTMYEYREKEIQDFKETNHELAETCIARKKQIAELEKENAELKTKKIPQLERKIASIRGAHSVDCKKLNARTEQVDRLKKENAELKEEVKNNEDLATVAYMQGAEQQKKKYEKQITKVKELIENIIRVTWGEGWNYSLDWKVKAEQFLSEVEK